MSLLDTKQLQCSLLHISDSMDDLEAVGPKRHSLQAVELSQRTQAAVQIVSNLPDLPFLGMPVMRTRWMVGAAAHKSE